MNKSPNTVRNESRNIVCVAEISSYIYRWVCWISTFSILSIYARYAKLLRDCTWGIGKRGHCTMPYLHTKISATKLVQKRVRDADNLTAVAIVQGVNVVFVTIPILIIIACFPLATYWLPLNVPLCLLNITFGFSSICSVPSSFGIAHEVFWNKVSAIYDLIIGRYI